MPAEDYKVVYLNDEQEKELDRTMSTYKKVHNTEPSNGEIVKVALIHFRRYLEEQYPEVQKALRS